MEKTIAALKSSKWFRIKWIFLNIKQFYFKHCVAVLAEEPHSSQAFPVSHLLNQNDPNNVVRDLDQTK